jgi:hypothetical protein
MPLNAPPHPMTPKPKEAVEIFQTTQPTKPFVEVGMISVGLETGFSGATDFMMVDQLRGEGAGRGCDGIILTGSNKRADIVGDSAVERTSGVTATCIVYR